jgi:hypothetical protein
MRKALFDRIGFFDENLNTGEIISLLTNMDKLGFGMADLPHMSKFRKTFWLRVAQKG